MKVSILGTEYEISIVNKNTDARLINSDGYCDGFTKKIVISDLKDYVEEPEETKEIVRKAILRHEIIHAFLDESGLSYDALQPAGSWAKNEEMVDWIALQFSKILIAFQKTDCL